MSFGFSIGDIIACSKLAVDIYDALSNAPKEFEGLRLEFRSLNTTLKALAEEEHSPTSLIHSASPQRRIDMKMLLDDCRENMKALQKLVKKYDGMDLDKKSRILDRISFASKDKRGVREKLALHTASIAMFLSGLTYSGLGRLEFLFKNGKGALDTLFAINAGMVGGAAGKPDVNAFINVGPRDPNASSTIPAKQVKKPTTEGKAWVAVWKGLVDEGVNDEHVDRFAEDIKAYVRYLVSGQTPFWEAQAVSESGVKYAFVRKRPNDNKHRSEVQKVREKDRDIDQRALEEARERRRLEEEHRRLAERLKAEEAPPVWPPPPPGYIPLPPPPPPGPLPPPAGPALKRNKKKANSVAQVIRASLEKELLATKEVIKRYEILYEHSKIEFDLIQDPARKKIKKKRKLEMQKRIEEFTRKEKSLDDIFKSPADVWKSTEKVYRPRLEKLWIEDLRKLELEMEKETERRSKADRTRLALVQEQSQDDEEIDDFLDEFEGLFEVRERALEEPLIAVGEDGSRSPSPAAMKKDSNTGNPLSVEEIPQDQQPPSPRTRHPKGPIGSRRDERVESLRHKVARMIKRYDLATADNDQATQTDLYYYAMPDTVDQLVRLGVKLQKTTPWQWATCDHCELGIVDGRYHCSICQDGDWDACQDCWNEGLRCLDQGHEMKQISLDE